jgi:hypothetical protein
MRPSETQLLCAVLLAVSCSARAAVSETQETDSGVCILVFNYAAVPSGEMARARTAAGYVLARAGIKTHWTEFLADGQGGMRPVEGTGDCNLDGRLGPTDLAINISPPWMARKYRHLYRLLPGHFGFALVPPDKGMFGNRATVFLDLVVRLGKMSGVSCEGVLGYAIAHEIGHLLLGAGSHSPSGIMRASWRWRELRQAATGALHFTENEARSMRLQVYARPHANRGQTLGTIAAKKAESPIESM